MRLTNPIISVLFIAPLIRTYGFIYEPEEDKEFIEEYGKESLLFDLFPDENKKDLLILTSPEDVGVAHTKIIHDLNQRMTEKIKKLLCLSKRLIT